MKKKILLFVIAITIIFKVYDVFINKGGIFYPKIVFGFKPISNFYWGSAYTAMDMADNTTPEINVLFRRAGNNFKSSFYPVFLTKKAYSQIYINKIMYIYENNNITVLENAIFTFPDKIIKSTKELNEIGWLTNGEYYCLNGWSAEPENWKDKAKLWPETNFSKIFKDKKVGDEFSFKIMIYYQFDSEEMKLITLDFKVTAAKGRFVSIFEGF